MGALRFCHILYQPRFCSLEEIVGGEEVRPFELRESLLNLGEEVYLITGERSTLPGKLPGNLKVLPLPIPPKPLHDLLLPLRLLKRIREILKKEKDRAGTFYLFYSKAPTALGFLKVGIPFHENPGYFLFPLSRYLPFLPVAVIHDLEPDHSLRIGRLGKITPRPHPYWKAREQKFALRHALLAITVSEGLREKLKERYQFPEERCFPFLAGVRPELVRGLQPPREERSVRTLGYLGSARDTDLPGLLRTFFTLVEEGEAIRLKVGGVETDRLIPLVPERFRTLVEISPRVLYHQFPHFAEAVDLWVIPYPSDPYFEEAIQLKIPLTLASLRPVLVQETRALKSSEFAPWLTFFSPDRGMKEAIRSALRTYPKLCLRAQRAQETLLRTATWEARTREWLRFVHRFVEGSSHHV